MENPLEHPIFRKYAPFELNKKGCEKLIVCYSDGLKQIHKVYLQEVLEKEKQNPIEKRSLGIKRTRYNNYIESSKKKKISYSQSQQDLTKSQILNESSFK